MRARVCEISCERRDRASTGTTSIIRPDSAMGNYKGREGAGDCTCYDGCMWLCGCMLFCLAGGLVVACTVTYVPPATSR